MLEHSSDDVRQMQREINELFRDWQSIITSHQELFIAMFPTHIPDDMMPKISKNMRKIIAKYTKDELVDIIRRMAAIQGMMFMQSNFAMSKLEAATAQAERQKKPKGNIARNKEIIKLYRDGKPPHVILELLKDKYPNLKKKGAIRAVIDEHKHPDRDWDKFIKTLPPPARSDA